MTDSIKQILQARAKEVDVSGTDLDSVMRAGDRLRRRRVIGIGAAAAVLAVVGGATYLAATNNDDSRSFDPVAPAATTPLTYAQGTTLHYGAGTVEIPPLRNYERLNLVPGGVVFAAASGGVYFSDGMSIRQIGSDAVGLVSSAPNHPIAAWVTERDGAYLVVRHDLESGDDTEIEFEPLVGPRRKPYYPGMGQSPVVVSGVVGDAVHVEYAIGDIVGGTRETQTAVLPRGDDQLTTLSYAEAPRLVVGGWGLFSPRDLTILDYERVEWVYGVGLSESDPQVVTHWRTVSISPDLRYVSAVSGRDFLEDTEIFDLQTQAMLQPQWPDNLVLGRLPLQWVDGDTIALVAESDGVDSQFEIVLCDVEGGCRFAARLQSARLWTPELEPATLASRGVGPPFGR